MAHRQDSPPQASGTTGLKVLNSLARKRSMLAALSTMHEELGDVFQISLPAFEPVFAVGPDCNRSILVSDRDKLAWRIESDAVVELLRHGLLVEDDAEHDRLRDCMSPSLAKHQAAEQVEAMWNDTRFISDRWSEGQQVDMLVEMRKVALLILLNTTFKIDARDELDRIWEPILAAIRFISPGLWIVWPDKPRPGYDEKLAELDAYLFEIIARRRSEIQASGGEIHPSDMLGALITARDMPDELIRDQLLTMLIAGHDTSTALLAWTWYLLGSHPDAMRRARKEVDGVLGGEVIRQDQLADLNWLDWVVKESLRLYPPIHVGNRVAREGFELGGHLIPAGSRVMYSIYLCHRHPDLWEDPDSFRPERFDPSSGIRRPSLSYVPFGGGPRNCIGAAFAQVEAKAVLAALLQSHRYELTERTVRPHMGATLEPRPGVRMTVYRR